MSGAGDVYFTGTLGVPASIYLSKLGSERPSVVDDGAGNTPVAFLLDPNFPNPFNPKTTISFELARESMTSLTIYDVSGRLIHSLIPGRVLAAGAHRIAWSGTDESGQSVPAGVYFYKLKAGGISDVGSMALVK